MRCLEPTFIDVEAGRKDRSEFQCFHFPSEVLLNSFCATVNTFVSRFIFFGGGGGGWEGNLLVP